MKETITKIYRINTNWWDSFTSCFVGTLLGIVVTFGVSGYLSRKEHRDNERTMQVVAVGKIGANIVHLRTYAAELQRTDSLYSALLSYYPDSLDHIPGKLVYECLNDIVGWRPVTYDVSVGNFLRNNPDLWVSMTPSVVGVLDKSISLMDCIVDNIEEIHEAERKIVDNMTENHYIYGVSSVRDAVRMIFEKPQNPVLLSDISYMIKYINSIIPYCEELQAQIRTNLDITDEEFLRMKDSRYKDFSMGDGYMSF